MMRESEPALIRSLMLVHGAGSGPGIFDAWVDSFPGLDVRAIDLHEDLDIDRASMSDYVAKLSTAAKSLSPPIALCGWSMGGLVALMASAAAWCRAVVVIEPSPPGEIQGFSPEIPLEEGSFDPEKVYGPFPEGMTSRLESSRARCERKRGISIPTVGCPMLVISGAEYGDDRGQSVARLYEAEHVRFPAFSHWDLVLKPGVRERSSRSWLVSRFRSAP